MFVVRLVDDQETAAVIGGRPDTDALVTRIVFHIAPITARFLLDPRVPHG
jgi:hypothetical protein